MYYSSNTKVWFRVTLCRFTPIPLYILVYYNFLNVLLHSSSYTVVNFVFGFLRLITSLHFRDTIHIFHYFFSMLIEFLSKLHKEYSLYSSSLIFIFTLKSRKAYSFYLYDFLVAYEIPYKIIFSITL